MTLAVILWGHALAALMFALLAAAQVRRGTDRVARGAYVFALGATALWALAVAGIDARDVATRLAEGVRNVGWLGFMLVLSVRADRRVHGRGHVAIVSLYGAVALVTVLALTLGVIDSLAQGMAPPAVAATRQVLRMMLATGALLLVHQLIAAAQPPAFGASRLALVAVAALWGVDLAAFAAAYFAAVPIDTLFALRGLAMVGVAPLFALAAVREEDGRLRLSRTVALPALVALAVVLYAAAFALAVKLVGDTAGDRARLFQTALVFGGAAALVGLVSSPWLRAWVRVKLAKHLFRHRYDYRAEWLRFTDTVGQAGADAAALDARVVKAIADLTCSPAGVLLVPDGAELGIGAAWNWDVEGWPARPVGEALTAALAGCPRVIELDALRAAQSELLPAALREHGEAWIIVPLPHFGALAGAILLARPPIDRALDWEDYDLLRLAARQAASYLAEARAHGALADAHRFDEFNRRFAFIIHDIKNLASQLTLVARNAERHADNPAFRADMVATLKDSTDRMNALLARLSQHHRSREGQSVAVDPRPLAERIAARRRSAHPVAVDGAAPPVFVDPAALEQLLVHLVQNAVEASGADAPVRIALGMEGGRVAIDVIDRGCGMSPAFVREQLFRPFVSSKAGGFGIGAFEARQLAEAMGGTIEVESREGEGTRFRVLLPAANEMEKAA